MTQADNDRAREQAIAQAESINEMLARVDHAGKCEDLYHCKGPTGAETEDWNPKEREEYHDQELADQAIQEDPLDITYTAQGPSPDSLEIQGVAVLLCTGGPAVRIVADYDDRQGISHARIQYQDWGTPWTELTDSPADSDALCRYLEICGVGVF